MVVEGVLRVLNPRPRRKLLNLLYDDLARKTTEISLGNVESLR
jgi:hypothetical protein